MEQKTTLCPYLGRGPQRFFQLDNNNPKLLKYLKWRVSGTLYLAILGVENLPYINPLQGIGMAGGWWGFLNVLLTPHHLEIAPPKVQNYHKKAPAPSVVLLI